MIDPANTSTYDPSMVASPIGVAMTDDEQSEFVAAIMAAVEAVTA